MTWFSKYFTLSNISGESKDWFNPSPIDEIGGVGLEFKLDDGFILEFDSVSFWKAWTISSASSWWFPELLTMIIKYLLTWWKLSAKLNKS